MPSFSGSASELRYLSQRYNAGRRAFNKMIEVLPQQDKRSILRIREEESSELVLVLDEINNIWLKNQAKLLTKGQARAINRARVEGANEDEVKKLRRELKSTKERTISRLESQGGIIGHINKVVNERESRDTKTALILALGEAAIELELH